MGMLTPSKRVARVDLIDLDELVQSGVRCILIDRDNTCVPRDADHAPAEIVDWLAHARALGMTTCLVSNNFHSEQVEQSARELGCEVIHHAMKPAPFALWAALKKMGATAQESILIGDQLFTDVFAGSLSGIPTILVRPQSTKDLWYTQLFRIAERKILGNAPFEGEKS